MTAGVTSDPGPEGPPAVSTPGPSWAGPYRRHPGDLVRTVAASLLLLAAAAWSTDPVGGFERRLFRLVNLLPEAFASPLWVLMQVGSLAAVPVVAVVALSSRRSRLTVDVVVSGVSGYAAAKVLKVLVGRGRPAAVLDHVIVRSTDGGFGFPSGHATVAAALATAVAPHLSRRGRRVAWSMVGVVAVARVYMGAHLPGDVVGGVALGWLVGSVWHLLVGGPDRGPSPDRILAAAARLTGSDGTLTPMRVDARGSTPYLLVSGTARYVIKVLTRDNRDADLLFRLTRFLILRHREDESPFLNDRRAVEHEAYVILAAERAGVRVPRLMGTAVTEGAALLVTEMIPDCRAPAIADGAGWDDVWRQAAALHAVRIAHRDLRVANLLVDGEGQAWVIDFGFAEVDASDESLAADAAQLLVSTALILTPAEAVDLAVAHMPAIEMRGALAYLQPLAVSASTRHDLRHRRGLLTELREALASRLDVEPPKLAALARFRPRQMVVLAVLALAVHTLLPQLGDLGTTMRTIGSASPLWLLAALGASVLSYAGAAVALAGGSPVRIAFLRTLVTQVAGSFANRIAPAGLGGMGVNARYLQRHGVDRVDAVAAVGAVTLSGALLHTVLLVVAAVATGRNGVEEVRLPHGWALVVLAAVVPAVVGVTLATPLRRRVVGPLRRGLTQLGAVLRSGRRAALVFGGNLAVTGGYVLALAAALHAYAGDVAFDRVALVFLAGSAVASISPTPGGLGAMEAALVAGLTGLGVPSAPAVAGVLTFRMATFWLPTLPGWLAFRWLRRSGDL